MARDIAEGYSVVTERTFKNMVRADLDQQPYALYSMVKHRCQTVAGVAAETMPRDDGWRFLQTGWMLERAEMMCRPGATRSGLATPSTVTPYEENAASASS